MKGRGTDSTLLSLKFAGQLHSEGAKEVKGAAAGDVVHVFLKMPLQKQGMWVIFLLSYVTLFCFIPQLPYSLFLKSRTEPMTACSKRWVLPWHMLSWSIVPFLHIWYTSAKFWSLLQGATQGLIQIWFTVLQIWSRSMAFSAAVQDINRRSKQHFFFPLVVAEMACVAMKWEMGIFVILFIAWDVFRYEMLKTSQMYYQRYILS